MVFKILKAIDGVMFIVFNAILIQIRGMAIKKLQTAEDYRDLRQLAHSFTAWRDHVVMKTIERKQNCNKAICHHNRYRYSLCICFKCLRIIFYLYGVAEIKKLSDIV